MTKTLAGVSVAVAIVGSGCMAGMVGMGSHGAGAPSARAAPDVAHGGMTGGMMQACPMAVPGTQVAAADTPDGEATTFTTAPDRVAELRSRVHAMADLHNRRHQGPGADPMQGGMPPGGMGGGMMGGGSMGSTGMDMSPPSRATAEDVEGGARLVVTPNDRADLDRLRTAVRAEAQHMRDTGTCGMGQPGGR